MPGSPPRDPEVDRVLGELAPTTRTIAVRLRAAIRARAPELTERLKWGNPVWVGRGDVLCLMLYDDHVNLGLFQGAALAPRHPEIEGTGRSLRHLKVRSAAEATRPIVGRVIREAVALDRRREPGRPRSRSSRRGVLG
jgi:hypothetical protein